MKAQSKDSNSNGMRVISRSSIPAISSVVVEGITHNLGTLHDFRKHSDLASFIPENARPSFAWTTLGPHEELPAHEHPTSSMMIVAEGEGEVFGDCNQKIQRGISLLYLPIAFMVFGEERKICGSYPYNLKVQVFMKTLKPQGFIFLKKIKISKGMHLIYFSKTKQSLLKHLKRMLGFNLFNQHLWKILT